MNHITNHKPLVFFSISTFLLGQLVPFLSFIFIPFNPNNNAYVLPALYPPNWVFILVWLFLYPSMGLSMGYLYKLRKEFDVRGILVAYIMMLTANLVFVPIMNVSKGNPGILTLMDFNAIVSAWLFSWLSFKYSKTAFYWSLPLAIWTPITFGIKVAYWMAN